MITINDEKIKELFNSVKPAMPADSFSSFKEGVIKSVEYINSTDLNGEFGATLMSLQVNDEV